MKRLTQTGVNSSRWVLLIFVMPVILFAQTEMKWKAHDMNRPKPVIIVPPAAYLPVLPPSDAVVLFDGSDLSLWESGDGSATKWICKDGYFECVKGSGYIQTKRGFGDVQLHIEWAAPVPPKGESQGRGNSGVFLMGRYEVQVLDSYENVTYADGQAGAVYGQYPPQVNASRPPGEWQAYDIIFRRPRFDNTGKLESAGRMSVLHNGVLVQENVQLWGGTDWLHYAPYTRHADKLPLELQDHGNPVRFRNVWVRELAEGIEQPPQYPAEIRLAENILEKYTGTYQDTEDEDTRMEIVLDWGQLFLVRGSRRFELVPHSTEKFSTRFTAIDLVFELDNSGVPTDLSYVFTGHTRQMKKVK